MLQGILGRKLGMTQIFDEQGRWVGVTVIEAGPCPVTQVKTVKTDGYNAVQLGFAKRKRVTKPVAGHLAKSGVKDPVHYIREFRVQAEPTQKAGDSVTLKILDGIKKVDVIGITKGKGFQGVIKRWHKNCGPKTHGSMFQRMVGSASAAEDPGHIRPGTMRPGHMGMDRFTQKNLVIVKCDEARNLLLVRGAIPGPNGNFVIIEKSANQHVPVTLGPEKKDPKASKDPKKALAKLAGK
ncbi:MAG: large subunit ribosomal protein [Planctomycetota bacterium]|nr:MAG: large subunit ribosomal protein [Planctomycetota bacterium]